MTAATLFRVLAPLAGRLPTRALDYLAVKLADLSFLVLRSRRQAVVENLARILGPHHSKELIRTAARNCFRNHARCTVDTLRIPYLSHHDIRSMVDGRGLEHAFNALRKQRGLILVTLHLGNWDLFACYLGVRQVPLSIVVEDTEPATFAFYKKRREHTGIETIPLTAPPLAFARVLKANRVLGLVSDRDLTGSGAPFAFFNARRMLPTGPERLAKLFQSPVSVCYIVFDHRRQFRYSAVVERTESTDAGEPLMPRLVRRFEQLIRQYPDQWFVFENEWLN